MGSIDSLEVFMDIQMIRTRITDCIEATFTRVYGMIHKTKPSVLFYSFSGDQYSDNPRAISEELHRRYPEYEIVWAFQDSRFSMSEVPSYVKKVKRNSIEFYKQLATSCCFVINECMLPGYAKKKGQFFVQTWHGDRGFKKIVYQTKANEGIKHGRFVDGKVTDIFTVGSSYAEKRIPEMFHYYGEMLKAGCPRNDVLLASPDVSGIKKALNLTDEKVLLYAPTIRKKDRNQEIQVDIDRTLDCLEEKGEKWVCLLRAHPKMKSMSFEKNNRIIDVSNYFDMSDLLLIADMLLTDYSSCATDYILRKKPLILTQFDREKYQKEDRDFYVDINEIGFYIAKNQDELEALIRRKTDDDYIGNCESIMKYFGTYESGHASQSVCDVINENCMKFLS